MLGLPEQTELKKQIAKNLFATHTELKWGEQSRFDDYISSVYIVNEVSTRNIAVSDEGEIKHFYVLLVEVKSKELDDTSIKIIERSVQQHKILILKYGEEYRCRIQYGGLIQTEWGVLDLLNITLQGSTITELWENVIKQLGNIEVSEGKTLTEQIKSDEELVKLKKEIERLENKSRKAVQPKDKMKYHQQAIDLKKQLEGLK